jgi:hypothetical protein
LNSGTLSTPSAARLAGKAPYKTNPHARNPNK